MHLIRCGLRAAFLFAALVFAPSAGAQHMPAVRLSAREVAQVADEALRVIVPPDTTLSRVPVATRGIAFDARGTLAAFGVEDTSDTAFTLTRNVVFVTHDVTRDCSQIVPMPCASLGERAFVTIAPISVTASRALVRVTVEWATHVRARPDGTSPVHTYLSWFSATMHLARGADGRWVSVGRDWDTVVG